MGRIKIAGSPQNRLQDRLLGQDLELRFISQDGKEHKLPAVSFTLKCDGRAEDVECTVVLRVTEMDLDLVATFIREDLEFLD